MVLFYTKVATLSPFHFQILFCLCWTFQFFILFFIFEFEGNSIVTGEEVDVKSNLWLVDFIRLLLFGQTRHGRIKWLEGLFKCFLVFDTFKQAFSRTQSVTTCPFINDLSKFPMRIQGSHHGGHYVRTPRLSRNNGDGRRTESHGRKSRNERSWPGIGEGWWKATPVQVYIQVGLFAFCLFSIHA